MKSDRWNVRVLLLVATVLVVVGLFVVTVTYSWALTAAQLATAVGVLVLLGLSTAYLRMSFLGYTREPSLPEGHEGVPHNSISSSDVDVFSAEDGSGVLTTHQVLTFLQCIVAPRSIFLRITEQVHETHRSTVAKSTFTVRVATPESTTLTLEDEVPVIDYVLPLYLPLKNTLIDGLKVTDAAGKRLSTVDTSAQNIYAAAVIRFIIRLVSPVALKSYLENDRAIEKQVWDLLCDPSPKADEVHSVVSTVTSIGAPPSSRATLTAATDLISELALRRPVSVSVDGATMSATPWPSSLRFSIERRFVAPVELPPGAPARGRIEAALDSVRLALGVRLNRIYFPLDAAYRTGSYHLEVEGPEGTYFAGEEVLRPDLSNGGSLRFEGNTQPRRGQRRSHLYLHRVRGTVGAHYAVRFFERAPGSFAGASVAAFASTILIAVLAVLNLQVLPAGAPDRTISLVPTLLALPIAISAFVGLDGPNSRRHPSFSSRAVAVSTAFLSLAGFILAIGKEVFAVSPVAWHGILWLSVITTVYSLTIWGLRLAVENHFAKRPARQ